MQLWTPTGDGRRRQRMHLWTLNLSPDALRILSMIADGYENRDIAKEFGTNVQNVKNALRALYDHLGASNRAHAVAICYQRGILKISES